MESKRGGNGLVYFCYGCPAFITKVGKEYWPIDVSRARYYYETPCPNVSNGKHSPLR